MSIDFGSHVSVYRVDHQPPGPEDEQRIGAAARSLQFRQRDRIGPFDHLDLHFGGARRIDGVWGVAVILSGHYIGDDEDEGLDPETIIAQEQPVAEQFAEELAASLGAGYEVIPWCGHNGA
jgi:hypothetical protein